MPKLPLNLLERRTDRVYPQIMRQIVRLVCVAFIVLTMAVGPCQACFSEMRVRTQHSCCPIKNPTPCHGQSPDGNHRHTASCADVQVVVDPLKAPLILFEAVVPPSGWIAPEPPFQLVWNPARITLLRSPQTSSVLRC